MYTTGYDRYNIKCTALFNHKSLLQIMAAAYHKISFEFKSLRHGNGEDSLPSRGSRYVASGRRVRFQRVRVLMSIKSSRVPRGSGVVSAILMVLLD